MGKDSYALMTGIFVAALVTVLVVIIIWLGDYQHRTDVYMVATRESVTGLKSGSTVYYRGMEVGRVSAVKFDPNDAGIILVPIEVDKDVSFTRGLYATLSLKGVTGLTEIALQDDGTDPNPLRAGTDPQNRIPIKPSLIDRLSNSGEHLVKQTDELMIQLNRLLNEKNAQHVEHILANVETATAQFIKLQSQADKVLAGFPALTADARRTLSHADALTGEFNNLSRDMRKELKTMTEKAGNLAESGTATSNMLVQTTLPRANVLMVELQATTRRFKRVVSMLEADPQAFLLGAGQTQAGPGESGFDDPVEHIEVTK